MHHLALGSLVLGVLVVAPASPTSGAPATCDGRAVTIVAGPEENVVGTDGDDVILVDRAWSVDAKSGNDRICVDDLAGDRTVTITAGPGDDLVRVRTHNREAGVVATLGDGADSFDGGPTRDEVTAGESGVDDDIDHISTSFNADFVRVGGGAPVADEVDLGPGDDGLVMSSPAGPGHSFNGRFGDDTLTPALPDAPGQVVVDNRSQRVTIDGVGVLDWREFEHFVVGSPERRIEFIGGPGGEQLTTGGLVSARMGAGSDTVVMPAVLYEEQSESSDAPLIVGGWERDLFIQSIQDDDTAEGRTIADLGRGIIRSRLNGIDDVRRLVSIEDLRIYGDELTVRGSDHDNRIDVHACTVLVNGRGGDDIVTSSPLFENHNGCRKGMTFKGGAGHDVLVGGPHNDRLLGGSGHDRTNGRSGRDLCRAEIRVSCERK